MPNVVEEKESNVQHHVNHIDPKKINRRKQNAKILCEYMSRIGVSPSSVIDVGSGYGFFLEAANNQWSLLRYDGYDGPWIAQDKMMISPDHFHSVDLESDFTIKFDDKYDLCVNLEVAEHLEEKYSDILIRKLTESSDLILFSAAIPGQGGKGHKNEQHIDYWSKIFEKYGYYSVDILHDYVWNDSRLFIWFKNNVILFASKKALDYYKHFNKHIIKGTGLQRIHPNMSVKK